MIKDFLKNNKIGKKVMDLGELKKIINKKVLELQETLELISEDPSISSNAKSNIIINATALICGIIAVQPLPFADLFVLSPIQVVMVTYLSKVLGLKTSETTKQEILTYLVGTLGFGVLSQQVVLGLYKTIIPFAGAITTVPLVYMSTFGLGMACKTLIKAKKNNIKISKEELKRIRQEEIDKIKNEKRSWSIDELKKQYDNIRKMESEYREYKDKLKNYDKIIHEKNTFSMDNIEKKKQELQKRFSKYNNIKVEDKVVYTLCLIRSNEIINIEKVIGELDRKELKLRMSEGKAKYELENIGQIFISYENSKYIIQDVQVLDKGINNMLETMNPKEEMYHIANREIRDKFIKSFEEAKHSLYIASPWLTYKVVNNELIRKMEDALKRGVNIKIRYGIEDNSYNSQRNNRSLKSDDVALNLKNRFSIYGANFKIQKVHSHYKVMICDERYYIEGSYNFLSFDGRYDNTTNDHREEGATYGTNKEIIRELREKYFNF